MWGGPAQVVETPRLWRLLGSCPLCPLLNSALQHHVLPFHKVEQGINATHFHPNSWFLCCRSKPFHEVHWICWTCCQCLVSSGHGVHPESGCHCSWTVHFTLLIKNGLDKSKIKIYCWSSQTKACVPLGICKFSRVLPSLLHVLAFIILGEARDVWVVIDSNLQNFPSALTVPPLHLSRKCYIWCINC